jgi:flagellar protein FlaJ
MKSKYLTPQRLPLIIAGMIAAVGLVFYSNIAIMGNMLLIAGIVGIVPYALMTYLDTKRIKDVEDRLPVFLLDISEAQKIGMTLPEALKQVSRTDYGKLSPEIKKMNDQMSWGIPVQEVMSSFAERMAKSRLIGRIVRIINEAYNSGGDIARTMEATASDLSLIKEAEKERKAVTAEHMMVMYAIYFIFIGIVIGLSQTLVPMLKMDMGGGAGGIMSFQDPCTGCTPSRIDCVNCMIFPTICQMFGFEAGGSCYYNALFIVMAVIQGIFSGLVAGQIGEGSVVAGVKHSLIMTSAGFSVLIIMQKFVI